MNSTEIKTTMESIRKKIEEIELMFGITHDDPAIVIHMDEEYDY